MRIDLTVRTGDGDRDIAITAGRPVAMRELRPVLARVAGLPAHGPVWSGEHVVTDAAVLGGPGLRSGAIVSAGGPDRAEPQPGVLALHQVGGPGAGRVVPLGREPVVLGRGTECDVVLADADVSRRHATIEVSAEGPRVRDLGSTNGTWVDGERLPAHTAHGVGAAEGDDGPARVLRPGQVVRIGACRLTLAGPTLVPATITESDDGTVRVVRPPVPPPRAADAEIEWPDRSDGRAPRGVQWLAALAPAVAGGALAWIARSPQFLLFVLLSPIMLVSTSLGDRLHWRRSRRREAAEYTSRASRAAREVAAALRRETGARRDALPDPAELLRTVTLPGSRLWSRQRHDSAVLTVRIGSADVSSVARVREDAGARPAGTVHDVPIGVDLRSGPLGIAAPAAVRAGLARWVVAQLAALHTATDVAVSLLIGDDTADAWTWARWLPHLGGRVAHTSSDRDQLVADLVAVVEGRRADRRPSDTNGWRGPWHVVVADGAARLAEVPGLAELLRRGAAVGVSAICLDSDTAALPAACRAVAHAVGDTGAELRLMITGPGAGDSCEGNDTFAADIVNQEWADTVGRRLAPLVDAGASGAESLPDACGLLDALGVRTSGNGIDAEHLVHRWEVSDDGATTVLGVAADGPLIVDLAREGPHALIAGTTGAGKSELLQTLVAGLAAAHPPSDLGVVLIDYKGGAAFADCARLPHVAGLVTDLDEQLTVRALRSLHGELRRRERLLADAGVPDLPSYRATYRHDAARPALARLVIVVDEFATLAEELPDFVRGLVGVAQRGRSLGVHLVLATQRPGSAVSPEIRANTSLRVALRVTDAADSADVIDTADASSIARTLPGRGYLRSGGTLTAFQGAYGGQALRDDTELDVQVLGEWRRPLPSAQAGPATQLSALVDAIGKAAASSGSVPAPSPWLPPVPERLPRAQIATCVSPAEHAVVPFGVVDRPDEQRIDALTLDLDAGDSLLVAGAGRSGRSALLATITLAAAERRGPDELSVYVIDAAGHLAARLAPLPHCATVLGPDDAGLATTLFRRLSDGADGADGADAADGTGVEPDARHRSLVLVDDWSALVGLLGDADAIEGADALAGLLRAARTTATTVVLTGDRTVLAPRLAAGFATRVLLRMPDRGDFGLAGVPVRDVPASLPPGRGVRADDAAVVQVAHCGEQPTADELDRDVGLVAARWAPARPHPAAVRLRPLPAHVPLADLCADPAPATGVKRRFALGIGGDNARPVHLELFRGTSRLLVAGPPRSGRSTLLCTVLHQALDASLPVLVAAPARSPLRAAAARRGVAVVDPWDDLPAHAPHDPLVLLVDDCENYVDTGVGDVLERWLQRPAGPLAVVVAGRADDLATSYRGLAAHVRRANTGVLLRPGPVDGEILGVRLPRRASTGPAGRGVLVGDPAWGPVCAGSEPVPLQVAQAADR